MASETSETPRPRTAERPTPAELNGQAPAAEAPCADCGGAAPGERVLGLLGILAAVVIGAMGADLLLGGALGRAVGLGGKAAGDGEGQ